MSLTTCPSCGLSFALPRESPGGKVTCPNAACGKTFEARGPAERALFVSGATVASATRPGPRPPGARPELLDQLPRSFVTTPPMITVGGVFVLLYGLVLFGIVSAYRNRPEPPPPAPRT